MAQITPKTCKGCNKEYTPRHGKDVRCLDCYSKIGKRVNKRGKDNERDFAKRIEKTFGYRTRRTPMSGGMHLDFPSDLLIKCPPRSVFEDMHIDLKNAENWGMLEWYRQEKQLCVDSGTPFKKVMIIARKPGDTQNYVFMKWDDLEKILLELEGYKKDDNEQR